MTLYKGNNGLKSLESENCHVYNDVVYLYKKDIKPYILKLSMNV